jgi:hypothetical protein
MKVILSQQCESLTGALGRGYGYFLVKRGKSFYSQRSRHVVPPDGHWRFIVLCAELAQNKLHIADVIVQQKELSQALWEAHHFNAARNLRLPIYHSRDILNLKVTFGL